MSRNRFIATSAALLGFVVATAPAATAANLALEGEFAGEISYENCTVNAPEDTNVATGTWWINVHDTKATARFIIYVNDAPHVAYTTQLTGISQAPKATLQGTVMTAAGPLVVTVKGSKMTYRIAPYDLSAYGGSTCDSVTYHGFVTTP